MGKEAQFARAEVAPVVAGNRRWDLQRYSATVVQENERRFREKLLPNGLSVAIGLDLMNRPNHHAHQIKGEI